MKGKSPTLRPPENSFKAYSAYGPFTKNKERIQKLKETRVHHLLSKTN